MGQVCLSSKLFGWASILSFLLLKLVVPLENCCQWTIRDSLLSHMHGMKVFEEFFHHRCMPGEYMNILAPEIEVLKYRFVLLDDGLNGFD